MGHQMVEDHNRRHILITGATGGLGNALALLYANPNTKLSLWGRNTSQLDAIAHDCRSKGAEVQTTAQDIRDLDKVKNLIDEIETTDPVDLVILNAGVATGVLPNGGLEPIEDMRRTLEVNALSNMNMASAFLSHMTRRAKGHIAFTCSVAALYPLSDAPTYSASKVAISYYARGLRAFLADSPIKISIVYPGYIATEMGCRFLGPKPFMEDPAEAAGYIKEKLDEGIEDIKFPKIVAWSSSFLQILPEGLANFLMKRFSFTIQPDAESPAANRQ